MARIRVKIMGPPPIVNGKYADDLHLVCDAPVNDSESIVVHLSSFEPNPPINEADYFTKIQRDPGDSSGKTLKIKFDGNKWAPLQVATIDVVTDADDINCIEAKWTQGGTVVGNATIIP